MRRVLAKLILGFLLIMGMGMSQVIGVSRGYVCLCAPEPMMVDEAVCDAETCHDVDAGDHDRQAVVADDHGHDHSSLPEEGDHRHEEVREILVTTGVAAAPALPAPVWQDLPSAALAVLEFERARLAMGRLVRDRWLCDGSPPAALLVARVMVRLV